MNFLIPDKKLTDAEIVKVLENAEYRVDGVVTRGFYLDHEFMEQLIDLINRLQAENERLKKEFLEQKLKNNMLYETAKEIEIKAYKEFAERLKPEFKNLISCNEGFVYHIIDNLLKELTEKTN